MKATVYPGKVQGEVTIPPSKSMSHRAILCAALAQGSSIITNIAYSDDILATISAAKAMGATIIQKGDTLEITGNSGQIIPTTNKIDCGESGSTLRFIIPLFSLSNAEITFIGHNRLMKRPQQIYQNIFKEQELFTQNEDTLTIQGSLKPYNYRLNGNVSSQFITGLLYTLPLLKEDSTLEIIPPFESYSYVLLTIELLRHFGITIHQIDELHYQIPGNQIFKACNYRVEGDYSQLAFFAVLAAINSDLTLKGISMDSQQGDKIIIDYLGKCGISIDQYDTSYVIHHSEVLGTSLDLADCPDLGPILTILGMYAKGTYTLQNCARLRLKESDRIAAMEQGLRKLGVTIHSDENTIYMENDQYDYQGNTIIDGAKDHRIVMSFAVVATTLNTPLTITNAQAINKSYPTFFDDLQSLGIKVVIEND